MEHSDQGRLADNILLFCRTLRHAGLPVGTGSIVDAFAAIASTGIRRRDDFCHALRAVLTGDPEEFRVFDQTFYLYFHSPDLLQDLIALLLTELKRESVGRLANDAIRRLDKLVAMDAYVYTDNYIVSADRAGSSSTREILRRKDFEQMSNDEQEEARRILRQSVHPVQQIRTRRFRQSAIGPRYDLRRSMQNLLRGDGQLIQLERRRPRHRPPALVLLCDISGSMSRYSRMFLHYAHALTRKYRPVHVFVFGTRLTNITRLLRDRDVDRALRQVSTEVPDWDGGTRIAGCLQDFNIEWGRRVLVGNAHVALLCDGLERDTDGGLEFQMQRLRRSCRQLIWMNPMLRYAAFEPRASGIRAMLPHVDRFVPAHNIASLTDLGRMLAAPREIREAGRAA